MKNENELKPYPNNLNVYAPPGLQHLLREEAERQDRSISYIVCTAISEYLKRQKGGR